MGSCRDEEEWCVDVWYGEWPVVNNEVPSVITDIRETQLFRNDKIALRNVLEMVGREQITGELPKYWPRTLEDYASLKIVVVSTIYDLLDMKGSEINVI